MPLCARSPNGTTTGTLTGAQLSTAVRQLAVGLRAVVRLQANRLDKAD